MRDFSAITDTAVKLGCKVRFEEPLKQYTTFRVGGPCFAMIEINGAEACGKLIALSESGEIPYMFIGNGSNLIVDDKGFNGIVFHMGNDFDGIRLTDDVTIECSTGTSLSKLCAFAAENSLSGLEFAWGIPGSVGGAVFMNAGAYGGEISDVIVSAEAFSKAGEKQYFSKEQLGLSYRHSAFMENGCVITKAVFRLKKGEKTEIKARMNELMQKRKDKQPLEYPSAGSAFKRPEGAYAAQLIEQCGLKGFSVGGAEVSEKHSGFIINKNNATFSDIMELIKRVRETVQRETGFILECEPRIITYDGEHRG